MVAVHTSSSFVHGAVLLIVIAALLLSSSSVVEGGSVRGTNSNNMHMNTKQQQILRHSSVESSIDIVEDHAVVVDDTNDHSFRVRLLKDYKKKKGKMGWQGSGGGNGATGQGQYEYQTQAEAQAASQARAQAQAQAQAAQAQAQAQAVAQAQATAQAAAQATAGSSNINTGTTPYSYSTNTVNNSAPVGIPVAGGAPVVVGPPLAEWDQECRRQATTVNNCKTTKDPNNDCGMCLRGLTFLGGASSVTSRSYYNGGLKRCAFSDCLGCDIATLKPFFYCGLVVEGKDPLPIDTVPTVDVVPVDVAIEGDTNSVVVPDTVVSATASTSTSTTQTTTDIDIDIDIDSTSQTTDYFNCPAVYPGSSGPCVIVDDGSHYYKYKECNYYERGPRARCGCSRIQPIWACSGADESEHEYESDTSSSSYFVPEVVEVEVEVEVEQEDVSATFQLPTKEEQQTLWNDEEKNEYTDLYTTTTTTTIIDQQGLDVPLPNNDPVVADREVLPEGGEQSTEEEFVVMNESISMCGTTVAPNNGSGCDTPGVLCGPFYDTMTGEIDATQCMCQTTHWACGPYVNSIGEEMNAVKFDRAGN